MSKKFQVVIWEKTLKEARTKFESNLQDEDIIELRVCKKTVLRNFRQKHRVATERHLLDLNSNNFLGLCYPYALNGAQRSSDEILRYLGWN